MIFGWDIHDQLYSRELLISNKENGYRDLLARVDLTTYRRIPWEFNVPFFLVSFFDVVTKEPLSACPRGTLEKVTAEAARNGWQCMVGAEYEVGCADLALVFIILTGTYPSIFNSKVFTFNFLQ